MKPSLSSRAPVSPNMSLRFQQQQPMPGPVARHMAKPQLEEGHRSQLLFLMLRKSSRPISRNLRVPELEKHLVNQLSTEEVNSLNSKFKEATKADKKRCDNCLNEITERASADRREELSLYVSNVLAPPKQKSSSVWKEKAPPVESPTTSSSPKVDVKTEKPQSTGAKVVEKGAAYDKNEDESAKSAPNSQFSSSTVGSPSREFSDSNYGKTTDAGASLRNKESQSDDHAGARSMFSGDKGSDEPAWGTFDTNDEVDSVWGFNAVSTTKEESNKDHNFSGPGEFGLNSIRTGSSQGGGFLQKSRPFTFDGSVPSTPLSAFNSGYSPPRYKDSSEPSFDTFSRFDSFRSTQDSGFFPQPETHGRFDSMRSSRDFDQGHGFPTFDNIRDPFGSSVAFRSSLDGQTPRRDSDPFGSSGPFRTSLGSQNSKKRIRFFSGLQQRHLGHHSTVKLQEETRTHLGPLHLGHHSDGQTPRRDSDPFGSSGPFRMSFETLRKDSDRSSAF